jgi:hypothetical protein
LGSTQGIPGEHVVRQPKLKSVALLAADAKVRVVGRRKVLDERRLGRLRHKRAEEQRDKNEQL